MVGLLFCLSVINYLDRQSLSVLAPELRERLHFSVEQYSYIVTAFLVAYTLGFLVCGRILDRVGAKAGIGFAIAVWSVAGMLHAFARSWRHLAVYRFVLGLGESFNAPGGAKVIRAWVPKNERAFSMAIFSTGNVAGAILAPPLVAFIALRFNWQLAFVITGAVGFAWLTFWLRVYRAPEKAEDAAAPSAQPPFWSVLLNPLTGAFVLARFLTDSLPYFFSFWLPEYLRRAHHLGLAEIGMLAWIPYLAADLGGLSGGAASDWLTRRGWSAPDARRRALAVAACLTPTAVLAVHAPSSGMALACIALVLAAHSAWITNLLTLMTESAPAGISAQVVAWSGVGGSIGGIVANLAAGQVIRRFGYAPIFAVLGFVHLAALLMLSSVLRRAGRARCPGT